MKKKRCSKCGKLRLVKYFYKGNNKDGCNSWCKKCTYEYSKEYSQTNKCKESRKRQYKKKYGYGEEVTKQQKRNRKQKSVRMKKWRNTEEGRKIHNKTCREYIKERRKNDSMFKLSKNMITAMYISLENGKGVNQHYYEKVGYTFEELVENLTSKFLPGMTIENHGLWHVDHKRPISSFHYESIDDPEFKECWALDNLQPLWKKDNLEKSNKIS